MDRSKAIPDAGKVCVWILPEGSNPAVRVHVDGGKILSSTLFKIVCDTIGLYPQSRAFFGLFKGLGKPVRKYSDNEIISLPYRHIIAVHRWSFDVVAETKAIRTDPTALMVLAEHIRNEIKEERLKPSDNEIAELQRFMDPRFPSCKQYVDYARNLACYSTLTIKNVEIKEHVRLKTRQLRAGTRVNVNCTKQSLVLVEGSLELTIPWRKIRSWTQVINQVDVGYEIRIKAEDEFVWINFRTSQAALLLQATTELVEDLQRQDQASTTDEEKGKRAHTERTKFTWKLFKKEMFNIGTSSDSQSDDIDADYRENGRTSADNVDLEFTNLERELPSLNNEDDELDSVAQQQRFCGVLTLRQDPSQSYEVTAEETHSIS